MTDTTEAWSTLLPERARPLAEPPSTVTHSEGPLRVETLPPVAARQMAVLNEWFEAAGGAERVLLATLDVFPTADAYVLWRDPTAHSHHALRESWLARTPIRGRKAMTLPLIPFVWRTQTRRPYDVVLSLSHALNHTARFSLREGGIHLSYVHTPARYLWLPQIDRRHRGVGRRVAVSATKRLERTMSRHVTSYAANSREVQRRIQQFWGRDSRVIHPPVRTHFYSDPPRSVRESSRDYILGVGRWILYKNFDFMIDVASRAGVPLVLAGAGPMEAELRRRAGAARVPVTFEVSPSDDRVRELMWGARCLLFPCHEDFGIVPVEAQACGTPVVGLGRGGLLETMIDGETAFLLPELDVDAFADRVRAAGKLNPADAQANAQRFTQQRFAIEIRRWLNDSVPAGST